MPRSNRFTWCSARTTTTTSPTPMRCSTAHKRYIVGAGINSATTPSACRRWSRRAPTCCASTARGLFRLAEDDHQWCASTVAIPSRSAQATWSTARASASWQKAGADFVKIGIGGEFHLHHPRDQGHRPRPGGNHRGAQGPRRVLQGETGIYVPICRRRHCLRPSHLPGAGHGRRLRHAGPLLRRFDESPSAKVMVSTYMKNTGARFCPCPQLGSLRPGWQEEPVVRGGRRLLVPYAGPLKDNIAVTLLKIKSTMCNCGALTIPEFRTRPSSPSQLHLHRRGRRARRRAQDQAPHASNMR